MTTLQLLVSSPHEAHQVMNNLFREVVKPHTAKGAPGIVSWQTVNEYLRLKHRGAFHGYVLQSFSEQVWFTDELTGKRFRYSRAAWKLYLKQQFLTPKIEEYVDKNTGEIKYRDLPLSTEALSDDEYSAFLDECHAFGIDLGIEFPEESY